MDGMENRDDAQFVAAMPYQHGQKKERPFKTCSNCGAEFQLTTQRPGQKRCSKKCKDEAFSKRVRPHWARVERICAICGETFIRQRHQANQKTCGLQCGAKYRQKRESIDCKTCGKTFIATVSEKRMFCSKACMYEGNKGANSPLFIKEVVMKPCLECGKDFESTKGWQKYKKFCSTKCTKTFRLKNGGSAALPIGHISQYKDGYRYVKVEQFKWVPEHRLVAEKKIGRELLSYELVHHINGDPTDNKPENLSVLTMEEHMRVHDEAEKIGLKVQAGELIVFTREQVAAMTWVHPIEGMEC